MGNEVRRATYAGKTTGVYSVKYINMALELFRMTIVAGCNYILENGNNPTQYFFISFGKCLLRDL